MMWHGPHVIRRSTSPQEVMAILDLLPHIQDLELEHLQFLSEAVPAVIPTPPRSLRSFRLTFFCPTVVLQDIYNLLSCFRSISTVSFYETNLLHEPSVGLLHPPDELIKVKALELTFLNTGSASIWIDKVCTHLDFTSLTTLSVQAPLNVPHITDMTPALHRLLRRCTALQTLVCLRDVFHGLQTYQHACPSLHTLRFVKRLVADMPHLDSPWAKIQDIMGSPLAAAVCNVTFEVEFVISINHNEPNPDVSGLEQRFRRTLEALDWTPVVAIVERLRSMTISMEMKLRRSVEEVHDGGRSITCYSIPLSWDGDGRAYRTILESIVKERVPLSSHQRFDAHIVLSNPL
ncbi:hypothetical protein PsYK624_098970 [Phanerochaete sordida]|uniref:Uncharacterized protein n=1 Tax=Phanerochaete sordida TaxID=48140 RepID=A0A9P3GFC3_9APHY|nr:hypothetical protein PsYK624_098970 [Phanerochaete sordida]